MELKKVEGTIEQVILDKTKKGNDFVKIVIATEFGKRTVNIFDMKLYDKDKVSKGEHIAINCGESHWTNDEGQEVTSLVADSIIVKEVQKELPLKKETIPEKETDESSVEFIMEKCLWQSHDILTDLGVKEGIEFSPEDVRTVGVAMFIEACRRHK